VLLRHLVAYSRKFVVKSAYGSKLNENLRCDLKNSVGVPISVDSGMAPAGQGPAGGIIDS
jgi:hypothetical protein